jgi:hypothetical protein
MFMDKYFDIMLSQNHDYHLWFIHVPNDRDKNIYS